MTSTPVLAYPYHKKEFILTTDASGTAIGYVLSQKVGNAERVIAYGGRSLKSFERKYSISEREYLAIDQFRNVSYLS